MRSRSKVLPLLLLGLAGCATIDNGPMQRIHVLSDIEGAEVRAERCGKYSTKTATTPAVVWVSRRSTRCTLEIALPGYETEVVRLKRYATAGVGSYAGGLGELCGDELKNCNSLSDVIITSMIATLLFVPSIVVDAAFGSIFEQEPGAVEVTLAARPDESSQRGSEP